MQWLGGVNKRISPLLPITKNPVQARIHMEHVGPGHDDILVEVLISFGDSIDCQWRHWLSTVASPESHRPHLHKLAAITGVRSLLSESRPVDLTFFCSGSKGQQFLHCPVANCKIEVRPSFTIGSIQLNIFLYRYLIGLNVSLSLIAVLMVISFEYPPGNTSYSTIYAIACREYMQHFQHFRQK